MITDLKILKFKIQLQQFSKIFICIKKARAKTLAIFVLNGAATRN